MWRRFKWIETDLVRLATAVAELPVAVAETAARLAEIAEVVCIAVGIALALMLTAYVMRYAINDVVVPAGHIGYEAAHVLDSVVNWFIGAWRKIAHFFHIHTSSTKIHTADVLIAFKDKYECSAYESYAGTIAYVIQHHASRHVCPVARYVYSTLIFRPMWALIWWLSFDPQPETADCVEPADAWECVYVIEAWRFVAMASLVFLAPLIFSMSPILLQVLIVMYRLQTLVRHIAFKLATTILLLIHRDL